MEIKVDPTKPVLWIRVQGLDEWRLVKVYEVRGRKPTEPEPKVLELLKIRADGEGQVLSLVLPVDATGPHVLAARLRVRAGFAPGNDAPIKVELFQPSEGVDLPAPELTFQLDNNAQLFAQQDVAIKEAP